MEFVDGSTLTQFGIKGTKYCGPGYANGNFGERAQEDGEFNGPVDEACKNHDLAYDKANESATPAADRLAADTQLIADVSGLLSGGQLDAANMEIAVAILGAFIGKVGVYDIPAALIEAAQNLIRDLLRALGIDDDEPLVVEDFGNSFFVGDFEAFGEVSEVTNAPFLSARQFTPRIDPLAFDLDGDGLETVGITATGTILFDHDGDGIRTGTGWLKGDDAFLALDKNGNGTIDNGNELFGVDTVLSSGQKAANGFAALADLDSNHDGQFSSLDAQFANVRLWSDLNQDGTSTADELQSLADAGIASISLASTATNIPLTGGNVQSGIIGDRPHFSLHFDDLSLDTCVCRDVRDYRFPMFRCT